MNLTKLFNFNYLIENIKKSKSMIILLTLLVPVFSALYLFACSNSQMVFNFATLSVVNIIFMYIVPIALSINLFNYTYKRNSADFIGSMPISKKSIFATNTLGGIAIILLIQIVTAMCTVVLSQILPNIIVFGSMIWESFAYYTLGYICVFLASNLAMSFSGNQWSQIAATLLIIFLIPFLITSVNWIYIRDFGYCGNEFIVDEVNNFAFSIPSFFMSYLIENNNINQFNIESIVRTLIVSVIYICLGYFLFKKKKLELAGESFENDKIHLIAKSLTLIPFIALYSSIFKTFNLSALLIFLTILFVYYFVFDFITNKRQKLWKTVLYFALATGIIFCFYKGVGTSIVSNRSKKITFNDVDKVVIKTINYCDYDYDIEITSPVLLEKLEKEICNVNYALGKPVELLLKENNGKKYNCTTYISNMLLEEIFKEANKKINVNFDNAKILINRVSISKEEEKELKRLLKEYFDNPIDENILDYTNRRTTEFSIYYYDKHKLGNVELVVEELPTELKNLAMKICNQQVSKNVNNITYVYSKYYESEPINTLIKKYNPDIIFGYNENNEETNYNVIDDYEFADFFSSHLKSEIIEFIKDDSLNDINGDEEYFSFSVNVSNKKTHVYYSNSLEEVYKIFAKKYNRTEECKVKLSEEI